MDSEKGEVVLSHELRRLCLSGNIESIKTLVQDIADTLALLLDATVVTNSSIKMVLPLLRDSFDRHCLSSSQVEHLSIFKYCLL